MVRKWIAVKDKVAVGPKKKKFEDLTPQGKRARIFSEQNPEKHQQLAKRRAEHYIENRERIVKRKKRKMREQLLEVIKILGGKCDACEELFNPNLERTNLEIHHNYYDEKDLKVKQRYGIVVTPNVRHVLKMVKDGIDPKKKYTLLCKQCHAIETFSHQDPKKTFDMFSWLYGQGIFDKVLNDDDAKNNRKITEFLKQS